MVVSIQVYAILVNNLFTLTMAHSFYPTDLELAICLSPSHLDPMMHSFIDILQNSIQIFAFHD